MDLALFLLVLIAVVAWVAAPLRRGAAEPAADPAPALEAELRAAALREADLDVRMGKLSAREHAELVAELERE
jgi:cbb3-type cytochrome oxidase subunit 3